jgi:hypothetical protein
MMELVMNMAKWFTSRTESAKPEYSGGITLKRIAILTLNGYYNYGNRLQNYALQEVLRFLDFNVETIINETFA